MPEAVVKGLLIAGGVSLTCFVIGLLIYAGNQGSSLASNVIDNTAGINESLTNSNLNQYDMQVVYGSEVLNAIRKFQGDLTVSVSTLDSADAVTETNYVGAFAVANAPFLSDGSVNASYINPYASFEGKVIMNANGVASRLQFTQRSYIALADTGPLVGNNSSLGGSGGTGGSSGESSGGIDYSTLQDVVNNQSATLAEVVAALDGLSDSSLNSSTVIESLRSQMAQLSTEQAELAEVMADMKSSIEGLEDLSVKIDALEGTVSSIGSGGGGVFDKSGTFTFRAGKTYYLSAIACGGAGGTASLSYVVRNYSDGSVQYSGYSPLHSGAGGNRGEYIIRREIKFDKDTQAAFVIGTNSNNGNTVITFETGDVITLRKGNGGGGAPSYSTASNAGQWQTGYNSYTGYWITTGRGGAGGFYKTTMKDFTLVNGSGSTGGNGVANLTTVSASNGNGGGSYTVNYQTVYAGAGGGGGAGYGAGGGGGGSLVSSYYNDIGYVWLAGSSAPAVKGSGGAGAPGVVIIETE